MRDFMTKTMWKFRRRYLMAVTAFTMVIMVMSVFYAEVSLAQTIINMGFTALIGFTGTYVFGAIWDDQNARKSDEPDALDDGG